MKTDLFSGCSTVDQLEQRFQDLSRVFSTQEEMLTTIKEEYSTLMESLNPKPVEVKSIPDVIQTLQEKVNLQGMHLELCGNWLWLSGRTFQVRDALKELGFRYSKNKLSWYWRSEDYRSMNQQPVPFEFIKEKYGSQEVSLG